MPISQVRGVISGSGLFLVEEDSGVGSVILLALDRSPFCIAVDCTGEFRVDECRLGGLQQEEHHYDESPI